MTTYTVTDAKTGETLGQIERFRKETPGWNGRGMRPSRVWYRLASNYSVNADTRGCIAAYLGGTRRTRVVKD